MAVDRGNETGRAREGDVFKICTRGEWEAALVEGVYRGSEHDLRDGFIHFSRSEQLGETARRHFAGQHDLVLVRFDAASLGDALRFEPSRGGALFPHLHAELRTALALETVPLPWDEARGAHVFPDGLSG